MLYKYVFRYKLMYVYLLIYSLINILSYSEINMMIDDYRIM